MTHLFFQPREQSQRIAAIDRLNVTGREFEFPKSIHRYWDAHEGEVGPEEELRNGNELRQCGKGRRVGPIRDIEI